MSTDANRIAVLEQNQVTQTQLLMLIGAVDTKLTNHIEETRNNFQRLETRIDGLETRIDGLDARLGHLEVRMDRLEANVEKLMVHLGVEPVTEG